MTFLEKIRPHLISENLLVQETVLHAIHDYPFLPEDWTNELLKAAFNNKDQLSSILTWIDQQPIGEEALNILLEQIPLMDPEKAQLAIQLLDKFEPELALKYKESLKGYYSDDFWSFCELLVDGTEEEVYQAFGSVLAELEQSNSFQQNLFVQAKKLAACVVKNGWITENEIDAVIQDEINSDWFSFVGILTVYQIGLLKLDKYIPVLASLLDRDDDILLDEVSVALIGFQSDVVVEAVAPYVKNENAIIFATSIIENIKTDFAVETLREAYRHTEELENQELIIEALCHQLSLKALPEISQHMEMGEFTSLVDLEQTAYGYFTILGLEHPHLEHWRKDAMEREMNYRNETKKDSLHSTAPIINEKKVGRNEPCPCGSGKKYKKCCGK